MGKSAAQIRRLQHRASKRGEIYTYAQPFTRLKEQDPLDNPSSLMSKDEKFDSQPNKVNDSKWRANGAIKWIKEFERIESDTSMNAKARRSAKRKAESTLREELGCSIDELKVSYFNTCDDKLEAKLIIPDNIIQGESKVLGGKKADPERCEAAAMKMVKELERIDSDTTMNAKARRSVKRKAEAKAMVESGRSNEELTGSNANVNHKSDPKSDQVNDNFQSLIEERDAAEKKVVEKRRVTAVMKMVKEMERIESDVSLNAKSRRSAKKKAEAIAVEESGCSIEELNLLAIRLKAQDSKKHDGKLPYVLFVGQIAWSSSSESIFKHFQKALGSNVITSDNFKVRLLANQENGRSRGMAFIEVDNPELLFECLKMHHTVLDGRRINVERSSGGSKHSQRRKERLIELRKEQNGTFILNSS